MKPTSFCIALLLASPAFAAEPEIVNVWPAKPPGETKELPPEANLWKDTDTLIGGKPIIKLTNVSTPTLAIYRPAKDKDTGAAVIICPGGGHHILAFDHEGTETAEWLNTLGVTGIVLKYRVPFRNPDKRYESAVQDAQRAMRVVRSRAKEWNLDPERIGLLGFSAGGETAGLAAYFKELQYPKIDAVDDVSGRPDFAVLVYPAYFVEKDKLRDYIPIDKDSPPTFLVHAFNDGVTPLSSLLLATELKKAGVSCELHLYATGGHGYGMRDTGEPVNSWPQRCEAWLKSRKIVK